MTVDLRAWNDNLAALKNIEDVINEIRGSVEKGMCGSPQPEYLFSLSYSLKNRGAIVEIGTCGGHSLVALAYAQKMRAGRKVTTIDIIKHPSLDAHIDKAQTRDWVDVIVADANDVAKGWTEPIELLWIDGDHRYEGAKADILSWESFIIKGGLIALHDYRDGTGVGRAIHETLLSRPWVWKVVSDRAYGSIFVVERIAADGTKPTLWVDELSKYGKPGKPGKPKRSWLSRLMGR